MKVITTRVEVEINDEYLLEQQTCIGRRQRQQRPPCRKTPSATTQQTGEKKNHINLDHWGGNTSLAPAPYPHGISNGVLGEHFVKALHFVIDDHEAPLNNADIVYRGVGALGGGSNSLFLSGVGLALGEEEATQQLRFHLFMLVARLGSVILGHSDTGQKLLTFGHPIVLSLSEASVFQLDKFLVLLDSLLVLLAKGIGLDEAVDRSGGGGRIASIGGSNAGRLAVEIAVSG